MANIAQAMTYYAALECVESYTERKRILDLCRVFELIREENGNGGSSWSASKVVITKWLNRGLWDNSTHKLNAAAKKLQQFLTLKDAASVTDVREESYYVSGIYSVTGCRLQSEPAHGVYIKNGKKVVR